MHHPVRHRRRCCSADRHVRRHAVQPGHLDDAAARRGRDRGRQSADAREARQGPIEATTGGCGKLRRGGRAEIYRRRLARIARVQAQWLVLMMPQDGDSVSPDPTPPSGAPVLSRTVTISNKRGMHARAAAKFVMMAERFGASVDVIREGQTVPARSIMGLMMLGAGKGSAIELRAEGWDAKEALDALAALVESGFDEQD